MGPQSWYLVQYLAIPLIVAGIIFATRVSIYRTIRLLSIAALVFAGSKWALFFVVYSQ